MQKGNEKRSEGKRKMICGGKYGESWFFWYNIFYNNPFSNNSNKEHMA